MPKGFRKGRGKEPGKSYARENTNKDLSSGVLRTRGSNRNPDVPNKRKVIVFPRTSSHRGMRERIEDELEAYYDSVFDEGDREETLPLYTSRLEREEKDHKVDELERLEEVKAEAEEVPIEEHAEAEDKLKAVKLSHT